MTFPPLDRHSQIHLHCQGMACDTDPLGPREGLKGRTSHGRGPAESLPLLVAVFGRQVETPLEPLAKIPEPYYGP